LDFTDHYKEDSTQQQRCKRHRFEQSSRQSRHEIGQHLRFWKQSQMSVKKSKQEEASMNDIIVVITGMILLMSPAAYDHQSGASTTINAAVAVNATDPKSSYGIDIPQHFASLTFTTSDLGTVVQSGLHLVKDGDDSRLDLQGDLVQLGKVDGNGACGPLPDDTKATVTNSIRELPRMGDLVEKADLADRTYPVGGVFKDIDTDKIAAWFEIPLGRLRAKHKVSPQDDEVMFHPLHRNSMVTEKVEWHIQAGKANCIHVTSFDQKSWIDIPFKPDVDLSVDYKNTADTQSGDMMPGVGFDFEVLYGLYKYPPAMPPIPFSVKLLNQVLMNMDDKPVKQNAQPGPDPFVPTNATTGVNCGPATIPSGG
jgi:hypothetical protein